MKFVAIDGEGQTDNDGKHRYVMLSIGDVTLMVNDGLHRPCGHCTMPIEGNIISVPSEQDSSVSDYFHSSCYYRFGRVILR